MSDFDRARKTAERAFMLMERHGIEPTPANVMAWFAYAAKNDEDWNRKLDQLVANRDTLPEEKQAEMICHFLLGLTECKTLFEGVSGLHTAVSTIITQLATAEGETSEFGRSLQDTAKKLESTSSLEDARSTLFDVVSLAQKMAARQQELAQTIKESSEEVHMLRNRLEEVHRQAVTDALTDLGNRRYFEAKFRDMVEEARQTGQPLSLVMVDIDKFKDFNDKHGHQTGDNVLKLVAGILKNASRGTDVAARIGGEEFGLILYRAGIKEATALAERVRSTLYARELVKRGAQQSLGRITISAGVAQFKDDMTVESLFEAADKALYQAKDRGRNQVITAE